MCLKHGSGDAQTTKLDKSYPSYNLMLIAFGSLGFSSDLVLTLLVVLGDSFNFLLISFGSLLISSDFVLTLSVLLGDSYNLMLISLLLNVDLFWLQVFRVYGFTFSGGAKEYRIPKSQNKTCIELLKNPRFVLNNAVDCSKTRDSF